MSLIETNYYRRALQNFDEFEHQISQITSSEGRWLFRGQGISALPQPRFLRGPNAKRNADGLEAQFIEHFHKDLGRSFPKSSFAKWRILTWLQHYGTPTRLLDWTEDSLVALWFAINARLSQIEGGDSSKNTVATVWIVKTSEAQWLKLTDSEDCLAPNSISDSKFVRPPEIDARVVAQRSVFSAHRLPRSNLDCVQGLWPDWSSKLKSGEMIALSCDDSILSKLFASLKNEGVTRRSIYPDLDDVSNDLNRKYLTAPEMYLVRSGIALPLKSKRKKD